MNRERRLSPRNLMLKDIFFELVEMAGGVNRAAEKTCVNASRISNYCSPNDPSMPPADVVLDLEDWVIRAGGEPIFTRAMADLHGLAIVAKGEGQGPAADYVQHVGAIASEMADVVGALGEALPGGVEPPEARNVCRAIGEAEEALARLKRDIKPVAESTVRPMIRREAV